MRNAYFTGDFNDLFADLFGAPTRSIAASPRTASGRSFPINLFEGEEAYRLEAELPGVSEQDLELTVKGNEVLLSVKAPQQEVEDGFRSLRLERSRTEASRLIRVHTELDPTKVEATLKNGVLTVKLPKAAAEKARKIAISTH